MKNRYILGLIVILAFLSISIVSAGLFDGFDGGNVNFLDLTMNLDGADFEDGDTSAMNDNYKINFYNMSGSDDERISFLSDALDKGSSTKLDKESISDAFSTADSSIANTINYLYDKETDAQKCAKTIVSLNEIDDYKDIEIDGRPASDFIVSDSVIYDESGGMMPDYMTGGEGKTSNDLARWILIYDDNSSTLYGIEIQYIKTSVVTDKSVLENDEVQSIIDSIEFK